MFWIILSLQVFTPPASRAEQSSAFPASLQKKLSEVSGPLLSGLDGLKIRAAAGTSDENASEIRKKIEELLGSEFTKSAEATVVQFWGQAKLNMRAILVFLDRQMHEKILGEDPCGKALPGPAKEASGSATATQTSTAIQASTATQTATAPQAPNSAAKPAPATPAPSHAAPPTPGP